MRSVLIADSADRSAWEKWLPTGAFYGITTNPAILERDGEQCTADNLASLMGAAADLGAQEVQFQAWGRSEEALVASGLRIASLERGPAGPRCVVKVPATYEGARAARRLVEAGARVTVTGVYNPGQVLTAVGIGADYAAPYLGRMTDNGRDGAASCEKMQSMIDGVGSEMRLLVASVRSVDELTRLMAFGVDTFTFGPAIAEALWEEDLTREAAANFEGAAERMGATPLA